MSCNGQVLVGENGDEHPSVITTETLDCVRTADTATCATPVGGQRLTVAIPATGVLFSLGHSAPMLSMLIVVSPVSRWG